ncbi:MAG: hypothetical protein JOZ84_10360 [Methylobacteriaceae bacterium]|nr:hypothetical protein [Methylobacteriaceae bacterium]
MLDTRQSSIESDLLDLRRALAAFDVQVKCLRLIHVLRKYSADQPRVPAGTPEGGQWTSGGGGGGSGGPNGQSDSGFESDSGDFTSLDEGRSASSGDEKPPEIPEEEPSMAKERYAILKLVARAANNIAIALAAPGWFQRRFLDWVVASNEPPKTLEELQQISSWPRPGYDIHHIVEQGPAEQDGFPRSQIDAPENLVQIPTLRHWQITAWYARSNPDFDWLTPREYLRGQSWDERTRVGLDALVRFGVLAP